MTYVFAPVYLTLPKFVGAAAALLAGIPFTWAAVVTYCNATYAKKTGELIL